MNNQLTAGHDDTRPALMDLQLFAEKGGAGGAGDAGDAGDTDAAAGAVSDTVPGDSTSPVGAGDSAPTDGEGASERGADGDTKDAADKEGADVPEKYELTVPEGYTVDDNLMAEFTGVAHELGLNNDQANRLAGMHTKIMTDAFQALNEARTAEVTGWGEAAKQELGKDYDGTLREVAVGLSEIEKNIPTLRQAMDKTGFGNTVEGIRLMATIGKLLGEDQGGKDAGGRSAATAPLYSDMADFKK